ncbi:hypothetical protein H0H92_005896 [Tricholoma furcatifolium]|nr:hypothetical protein H0H92_005896 [Tricholoma furcatifolium]
MLNASDPLIKLGITALVCTLPAIASTIYRLWIRRGRYWADDLNITKAWALAAALSQLIMFTGVFIHITDSSPHSVMIAAYYLMASTFYTVVWFSRLSILFSIIRIDPNASRRRILYFVAAVFFIITLIFVAQLFWVCEPMGAQWKNEASPQCRLTDQVVVMQLVISLVHAAFILIHAGDQEVMAAIVEDCVSLIVSNLPVVVTALLAIRRAKSQSEATTAPVSRLRFATLPANNKGTITGQTTTLNAGTTVTVTPGWANPFRWERDLRETDSEESFDKTGIASTTTDACLAVSNSHDAATTTSVGIRIDREVYVVDDTDKPTWHLQGFAQK